jgi:hypothetical protein
VCAVAMAPRAGDVCGRPGGHGDEGGAGRGGEGFASRVVRVDDALPPSVAPDSHLEVLRQTLDARKDFVRTAAVSMAHRPSSRAKRSWGNARRDDPGTHAATIRERAPRRPIACAHEESRNSVDEGTSAHLSQRRSRQ